MAKKRYIALGMVIGMILTTGFQVYAADGLNSVTAYIRNNFKLVYNDEPQIVGDDIIVYNDRTYLPLRYMSNLLGCDIEWNGTTDTITVTQEKPEPESDKTENGADVESPDVIDTTVYGELPQSVETLDYMVTAMFITSDDDRGDKLQIKVKNKSENKILRLNANSIMYNVDGIEFKYNGEINSILKDERWYSMVLEPDISNNPVAEGYFRLPKMATGAKNLKVTFDLTQDGVDEPIPITLNIKLSK